MPFKSSQQSKACFATNGWGGKVDCKKWAHKTKYKKLPQKLSFKEFVIGTDIWGLFAQIRNGDYSLIELFKTKFNQAHTHDQKRAAMFIDAVRERIQRGATTEDWQQLEIELRHLIQSST